MPEPLRDLSLAEHTVLAVVGEEPAHGFAVAALTAAEGALGRVWQVPRPIVYRALTRLEELGLVSSVGEQPGRGPQRRILAVTPQGAVEVASWLASPVRHVRDVRSQLLMKLALLDRRGTDPGALIAAQRAVLAPIVEALEHFDPGTGFDVTLAAWRRVNAGATLAFLDELLRGPVSPAAGTPSGRPAHPTP